MKPLPSARLAAAATLIGAVALGGTAGATGSVAAPHAQPATPQIELVDQTTWVQAGGIFEVQVRVVGAPIDASIELVVHDVLPSRQAFTESLAGEVEGVQASTQQPLVLDGLGTMQLSYPVGADGAGLGVNDHGVYPVSVIVADAAGESLAQLVTYLVLQPDPIYQSDYPPLSVAVVMDVGAPPGLQPDGTVSLVDDELAQIASRVDVLGQVSGLPLTVAPVPETLDALADDPDSGGVTMLQDLRQAAQGRDVLSRPYVDLDPGTLAASGMLNLVPPEADAGAQAIRFWFGAEPVSDVWLTGPTASPTMATALQDLGVTRAIVPSSAVASVPDETDLAEAVTGPVALADGGPAALVADDVLATRLLGQEGRLDTQRFVAELAMIWALAPAHTRGVVVRVPAQSPLEPEFVVETLSALADDQVVVRPVTIDEMFDTVPPPGDGDEPLVIELSPDDGASANLDGLSDALLQAQTKVTGLAAMLDDSALIRSLHRSLWIAPGSETPDDERLAYVDRVDQIEAELAAAINAPAQFRITLTAREGAIPLSIDNTSDRTVRVKVHLTSSQMEFPDGETLDVDVPPGGRRVEFDVRLRASGAFPLGVRITSPDDSLVLDRTTFTIRSTAISGVGLVLSIGAGLFLLIWWARHWRTARRSARLVQEHPASRGARERALVARRD
jgi:hypothetical protein